MSTEPRTTPRASLLISVAAFVVVVAGMRAAESLIVPFLLAVFVAVVAAPPVFWLERRGLPKLVAMLSVLGALGALVVAVSALVNTSIRRFTADLPRYKARLAEQTSGITDWLQGHGVPLPKDLLTDALDPGATMQLVADLFNGLGGVLGNAFLIFLMVIFILLEAHSFKGKVLAVATDPEEALARFQSISDKLNRYLAIKTLASIATGAVVTLWLAILGVDFPLLWGVLATLLNFVPNIGSVIAAVPAVIFAFIQIDLGTALAAAAGYAAVNVVVGNVVEPRFMGRGLGLSTLVVFASLVFWGWVLGLVGMFLSVPLTMTAKIALEGHDRTRWIALLLGPEDQPPPLREHEG